MRTTLTLDPDIFFALKETARREGKPFKEVVNEKLRIGLSPLPAQAENIKKFKVIPKHCGFRPGVDTARLNQISDELEAEEFIKKVLQDIT